MGIGDRDYMRRDANGTRLNFPDLTPRPWWRRIKWQATLGGIAAVLAVGSAAIWFVRDARGLIAGSRGTEVPMVININTASIEQLESLPQIGPVRAQLIFQHRPFANAEDLKRINGIPDGVIDDLKPFVRFEGDTASVE